MTTPELNRIGIVVKQYYDQLTEEDFTQSLFNDWIESLSDPMKKDFKAKGLDNCKGVLNFRRFILELKDIGLDDFLKDNLSGEDFTYWIELNS